DHLRLHSAVQHQRPAFDVAAVGAVGERSADRHDAHRQIRRRSHALPSRRPARKGNAVEGSHAAALELSASRTQQQLGEGELLDARGRLIACGYAASEVRRYRRNAVKAGPLRIKEWDYYCVLTDRYGL